MHPRLRCPARARRARVALGDGEAALGTLREAVDNSVTVRARFASVEQRVAFGHRSTPTIFSWTSRQRGELEEAFSGRKHEGKVVPRRGGRGTGGKSGDGSGSI
jgi:hypothetical protein